MVLVPMDTPGVTVVRSTKVLGFTDRDGHAKITFEDVRVPGTNLLAEEGDGFTIAQARLGPGRIHHCMRALGAAERALDLMCRRANERITFGRPLSAQGLVRQAVAEPRVEIDQARLLVQQAAWLIDRHGSAGAGQQIAAIKLGGVRGHASGRHVRLAPRHADLRRAGRGPSDDRRKGRAAPRARLRPRAQLSPARPPPTP